VARCLSTTLGRGNAAWRSAKSSPRPTRTRFRTKAREVAEGAAYGAVESQTRRSGAAAEGAQRDDVGVEDALADDKSTSGLQHAAELAKRSLLVGHLAQHLDEERGVEGAVHGSEFASAWVGTMFARPWRSASRTVWSSHSGITSTISSVPAGEIQAATGNEW
jgi:hypothetical protein